jgi:hypothetical protein
MSVTAAGNGALDVHTSEAEAAHARNISARDHYQASSIAIGNSDPRAIQQDQARRVRAVGYSTIINSAGE